MLNIYVVLEIVANIFKKFRVPIILLMKLNFIRVIRNKGVSS